MYPSGRWRGYWEQNIWGRQSMSNLVLRFTAGQVNGRGADIIGPFTLQGQYDDAGTVTLLKQYVGRHSVLYRGRYDGEGTIFGEWSIPGGWRGPFALSPEDFEVPADTPILTIATEPPAPEEVEPLTSFTPARSRR
jgi:hypothetical protein